jgi:hypothetical protein
MAGKPAETSDRAAQEKHRKSLRDICHSREIAEMKKRRDRQGEYKEVRDATPRSMAKVGKPRKICS